MTNDQSSPQYTPEQLAEAQAVVEDVERRKVAALAARKAAYLAGVRGVASNPEWATIRDGLSAVISGNEADGSLSIHTVAMRDIMARIDTIVAAS